MSADGGRTVGWVLAYGSLVDPGDPLVRRLDAAGRAVAGDVAGMRRTWVAGMENGARENDAKHDVDPDGRRPDVIVVTLSADEDPGGSLPVLALRARQLRGGRRRGPPSRSSTSRRRKRP